MLAWGRQWQEVSGPDDFPGEVHQVVVRNFAVEGGRNGALAGRRHLLALLLTKGHFDRMASF